MINRDNFSSIWKKINSHEIILLNGPRQVGKTTIMKELMKKLKIEKNVKNEQIIYYDLEISEDLIIWSDQKIALSTLPKNDIYKKYYIFIDEFQKSESIGSTLKVIHDHYPHIKLIITGSASWYLDINESLMGRKRVFPIWQLSFSEFLNLERNNKVKIIFKSSFDNILNINKEALTLINNSLIEFITYGAYPEVVMAKSNSEKKAILSEILNSYILKDIQLYNFSASSIQVRKILMLLSDRVGSLLDINNLSLNVELGRTAILSRLDLLKNTFVLNLLSPFYTNKTKEIVKNPKAYISDLGLRNKILDNFNIVSQTKYFGQNIENFIMTEFLKNNKKNLVYYWRSKNKLEVDFVIKKNINLTPIEIKSGNEENVPDGLKQFISNYKPKEAYVLNWSIIKNINYKNTKVKFRPLWYPIYKL